MVVSVLAAKRRLCSVHFLVFLLLHWCLVPLVFDQKTAIFAHRIQCTLSICSMSPRLGGVTH